MLAGQVGIDGRARHAERARDFGKRVAQVQVAAFGQFAHGFATLRERHADGRGVARGGKALKRGADGVARLAVGVWREGFGDRRGSAGLHQLTESRRDRAEQRHIHVQADGGDALARAVLQADGRALDRTAIREAIRVIGDDIGEVGVRDAGEPHLRRGVAYLAARQIVRDSNDGLLRRREIVQQDFDERRERLAERLDDLAALAQEELVFALLFGLLFGLCWLRHERHFDGLRQNVNEAITATEMKNALAAANAARAF